MRWRAGAAALAVLAVATVAACSEDNRPTTLPPIASPSTVPLATTPSVPSAAGTPASVPPERSIRTVGASYYEVVERAYHSLDTDELKAISGPRCGSCRAQMDKVEAFKRLGQRVVGADFNVQVLRTRVTGDDSGDVTIVVKFNGARIVDRVGRQVAVMNPVTRTVRVTVSRVDSTWVVTGALAVS